MEVKKPCDGMPDNHGGLWFLNPKTSSRVARSPSNAPGPASGHLRQTVAGLPCTVRVCQRGPRTGPRERV